MATYVERVLNLAPLSFWQCQDGPPLFAHSNGDTAVDEAGNHDGSYTITNSGLYLGSAVVGTDQLDDCSEDGHGFLPRGSTPIIAGIPDSGVPNGCIGVGGTWPDLTTADFTIFGTFYGADAGGLSDPGCRGGPGITLGGIHSYLSGGIFGTLDGTGGGGFTGYGLYVNGGFETDIDFLNVIWRVGAVGMDIGKRTGPHHICLQKSATQFRAIWDDETNYNLHVENLLGSYAQADPVLLIGTQNFNLALSGYYGNLSAGQVADWAVWNRLLTDEEIAIGFRCFGAKYSALIKHEVHVTR